MKLTTHQSHSIFGSAPTGAGQDKAGSNFVDARRGERTGAEKTADTIFD